MLTPHEREAFDGIVENDRRHSDRAYRFGVRLGVVLAVAGMLVALVILVGAVLVPLGLLVGWLP